MVDLELDVLQIPRSCAECPVLYLGQYCGPAIKSDLREIILSLLVDKKIPDGCLNGLGGLDLGGLKRKIL